MANINKVQDPGEHARKYGAYQNEVYAKGMFHNILPTITKDPNKLEAQAQEALPSKSYSYVAGGSGERATMDANRLAFRQWKVLALPPTKSPSCNQQTFRNLERLVALTDLPFSS